MKIKVVSLHSCRFFRLLCVATVFGLRSCAESFLNTIIASSVSLKA